MAVQSRDRSPRYIGAGLDGQTGHRRAPVSLTAGDRPNPRPPNTTAPVVSPAGASLRGQVLRASHPALAIAVRYQSIIYANRPSGVDAKSLMTRDSSVGTP